jgi:hypothetical protein
MRLLVLVFLFLNLNQTMADEIKSFELLKSAKSAAVAGNWIQARKLARESIKAYQGHRDAWLTLGSAEENLRRYEAAIEAYNTYLTLSPSDPMIHQTKQKITNIKLKDSKLKEWKRQSKEMKYSEKSYGVYYGTPLKFGAAVANKDHLDIQGIKVHDFGLTGEIMSGGLKIVKGTVPYIQRTKTTTSGSVTVTTLTDQDYFLLEFWMQPNIPVATVGSRNGFFGPFTFYVPLYFGFPVTRVSKDSGPTLNAIGVEAATGIEMKFFTRSPVSISLKALYHLSLVTSAFDYSSSSTSEVKNLNGRVVKASLSGFQVMLNLVFLFPNQLPFPK